MRQEKATKPSCHPEYVDYLATKNRSATIRRKINSLETSFRLSKYPDPTKEAEVIFALKRMHRRLGRRQKQAEPLTRDLFEVLLSSCTDDRKGIRNRILLRIGFETMRRRSELCKFKFENLQHSHRSQPMLFLETSKTDQEASGQIIPISRDLEQLINFGRLTLEADPKSFILRSIDKHGNVGQSLAPGSIPMILNTIKNRIAHPDSLREFSGHSFRVGAALDLLKSGVPIEKMMLRGGWRSKDTAMLYLRNYYWHFD